MTNVLKILIPAVLALVVGLIVGFLAGRSSLERKWAQPYATLTADEATRSASEDADPTPAAGAKILKAMPIGRARSALTAMTMTDPATCPGASVGAESDTAFELHVTVLNHGKCTIKEASGIAYGFDPHGLPAATNKHGEQYVAFNLDKPIEPGKTGVAAQKLRYAANATLAVAHIDSTTCTDGTTWKRQ